MLSNLRTIWQVLRHSFRRAETIRYPEQKPYLAPRFRGRIILSRDPDGEERCVACYLCAAACPVDCIALQAARTDTVGGIHPFSGSIFHGASCADSAKTPARPWLSSSHRIMKCANIADRNLVYEKEDLLISGPGKYPDRTIFIEWPEWPSPARTRARPKTNPRRWIVTT